MDTKTLAKISKAK